MIEFNNKRQGFSLITAIFVILFISSIGAMVLNTSGKMIQETVTQYKKEQSILYSKSYTELAILAATGNNCVNSIRAVEGGGKNTYNILVNIKYIGSEVNSMTGCALASSIGGSINHVPSKANSIIVDTYVSYKDISDTNREVKYFRRTVQKL